MTYINTIPPEKADGKLREIYQIIEKSRGKVADLYMAQSLNPGGDFESLLEQLKKAELDDKGTLDAVLIISYFNFVNRMIK